MANESPLSEADPHSLDTQFARAFNMNPHAELRQSKEGFTKNIETIVRELRRQREKWKVEEAQGKTRPTKARKSASAKTTLADLGLED